MCWFHLCLASSFSESYVRSFTSAYWYCASLSCPQLNLSLWLMANTQQNLELQLTSRCVCMNVHTYVHMYVHIHTAGRSVACMQWCCALLTHYWNSCCACVPECYVPTLLSPACFLTSNTCRLPHPTLVTTCYLLPMNPLLMGSRSH